MVGPPGSGKTSTIKALAKEINVDLQEWKQPNEVVEFQPRDQDEQGRQSYYSRDDRVSYVGKAKQFRNFMLRANRYRTLDSEGECKMVGEQITQLGLNLRSR